MLDKHGHDEILTLSSDSKTADASVNIGDGPDQLARHIDQVCGVVQSHLSNFFGKPSPNESLSKTMQQSIERLIGPATWTHEPRAYQESIVAPVQDMLSRVSKKWRPIFGFLLLNALNESEEFESVEAADYSELLTLMTELIHTGALIIDDIEDQSQLRRGDTCIHLRYGTDVAINAANFLYFAPLVTVHEHASLSDSQRLRIHALVNRLFLRGHIGQASDIWRSHALTAQSAAEWLDDMAESKILQSYADKTGCALDASVELVSVILGIGADRTQKLKQYSQAVGVAFQIMDDVKNFSDSKEWSKTVGEDIASGKMTYVLCRVLRRLSTDKSAELLGVMFDPVRRSDTSELNAAVLLVRESGVLQACEQDAYEMLDKAWHEFCRHVPDSIHRQCIRRMCLRVFGGMNSV